MPGTPNKPPESEENIWQRTLAEVQSRSGSSLPQGSVLVLGNNDSGKTSLMARLKHDEDPKKGAGLEFHYLEVNPDYRDGTYAYQLGSALPDVGPGESTRLGVWVLDGDPVYARMMRFAFGRSVEAIERIVVVLCASMAEPWSIMESLEKWSAIVEEQLNNCTTVDDRSLKDAKERQVRFWQEYLEPLDSSSQSVDMGKSMVPSMDVDQVLLPLGESTLVKNLGLPIVVVITKCDSITTLEKEYDFKEEHFDFIQMHVRNFCLRYGAALVYTSVKEARNCDILYKYLLHRIYGFPFTMPAHVVEKDAVFIPAGWDNEKKIGILHENLSAMRPTDGYTDHIKKPVLRRPVAQEKEVHAEDDQQFLTKQQPNFAAQVDPKQQQQQTPLSSSPLPAAGTPSPGKRQQTVESPLPTRAKLPGASPLANAASASPIGGKKVDGAPVDGNTSLAQFFNNLLSRDAAGAGGKGGRSPQSVNSSASVDHHSSPPVVDAAAELQRMLSTPTAVTKRPPQDSTINGDENASSGTDEEHNANRANGNEAAQPLPTS